VAYFLGHPVGL